MKTCKKCGVSQEEHCFFPHPRTKDGLQGHCKGCHAKRARELYLIHREDPAWKAKKRETYRLWEIANPDKVKAKRRRNYTTAKGRKYNLRGCYGMELSEYEALFLKQQGCCAICHRSEQEAATKTQHKLCVDHDHKTGKVRGLLCIRCNSILGVLESAEPLMSNINDYLSK